MNPIVEIKIKNRGIVKLELYPESAPNSVSSMIYLIHNKIYDNKKIRRIVKDFIIQPSYSNYEEELANYEIDGEFKANGFLKGKKLEEWSLALAGDGKSLSAGGEFFIVMGKAQERLIDKYPCMGQVIEGFQILKELEQVETKSIDIGVENVVVNEPVVDEIMESVTVETYGLVYEEPKKREN